MPIAFTIPKWFLTRFFVFLGGERGVGGAALVVWFCVSSGVGIGGNGSGWGHVGSGLGDSCSMLWDLLAYWIRNIGSYLNRSLGFSSGGILDHVLGTTFFGSGSSRSRAFDCLFRQLAISFGFVVVLILSTLMLSLSNLSQLVALGNLMQKHQFGKQALPIHLPQDPTFDLLGSFCAFICDFYHMIASVNRAGLNTLHSGIRSLRDKRRYLSYLIICLCIGAFTHG